MATINLANDESAGAGRGIRWTPLANGDVGQAWSMLDFADVSLQVQGTFGAGGTLLIEGNNEATPVTWYTLNDPQGNVLTFAAAKLEQLLEVARWIRPRVSAGDGTTAIEVLLWARRSR